MYQRQIIFNVTGKQPNEQEIRRVANIGISEEAIDDAKKEKKKSGLKATVICLIGAIICVIITIAFIALLEQDIVLFSTSTMEFKINPMLMIIPIGGVIGFLIGTIIFFFGAFKSPLQKSPEKLLKTLFLRELGKSINFDSIVPSEIVINKDEIEAYYRNVDRIIESKISAAEAEIRNEFDKLQIKGRLDPLSSNEKVLINGQQEIYPHVHLFTATIFKNKRWDIFKENAVMASNSQFGNITLQYNIRCILINKDEYWFPYDLTPEFFSVE